MSLTEEQKKAILKAIQAGKCTPEDITPARHVLASMNEGSNFVKIEGEPDPITLEQFEQLKSELNTANVIREELGLPKHSIHCLVWCDFS